MGVSYHKQAIQHHHIYTTKILKYVVYIKHTLKAFNDFKNKQKIVWSKVFYSESLYTEIKHKC